MKPKKTYEEMFTETMQNKELTATQLSILALANELNPLQAVEATNLLKEMHLIRFEEACKNGGLGYFLIKKETSGC